MQTGKHYNYFRDYDASIGRYVQSDPIGLRGGINTYSYVNGKPLIAIDRDGRLGAIGIGMYSSCAVWAFVEGAGFPGTDKKKHCFASCLLNKCTLRTFGPAWLAGFALEVSQAIHGTGYDSADMAANQYGIDVSYKDDCRKGCEECPIK